MNTALTSLQAADEKRKHEEAAATAAAVANVLALPLSIPAAVANAQLTLDTTVMCMVNIGDPKEVPRFPLPMSIPSANRSLEFAWLSRGTVATCDQSQHSSGWSSLQPHLPHKDSFRAALNGGCCAKTSIDAALRTALSDLSPV